MIKRKTIQKSLTLVVLIGGALIASVPLYWLVRSSLMTLGEIFIFPPLLWPKIMRWSNYYDAVTVVNFLLYFKNTMTIMIPVLFGTLLTSSMVGYGFARMRFPLKRFWFTLILSSLMLPYAVSMLPTFLLWARLGAINTFYPLTVPIWFGGGAFNIFLLRQFFLTIPRELEDAAIIDGASHFQIFARIMTPLIKPALIVVGLFTFLNVWNDFLNPLIYLNEEKKYTLALGLMQFQGTYSTDWSLLMAGATIVVIPPVIVFIFGQKYFIEGVTMTGLKV
ncbi:MAG: carbohydrate ABC transporter permease [Chloroflexota bacterium]|nr:carbohydrate ABC transporter permease [Chloroflexota bacterium]